MWRTDLHWHLFLLSHLHVCHDAARLSSLSGSRGSHDLWHGSGHPHVGVSSWREREGPRNQCGCCLFGSFLGSLSRRVPHAAVWLEKHFPFNPPPRHHQSPIYSLEAQKGMG